MLKFSKKVFIYTVALLFVVIPAVLVSGCSSFNNVDTSSIPSGSGSNSNSNGDSNNGDSNNESDSSEGNSNSSNSNSGSTSSVTVDSIFYDSSSYIAYSSSHPETIMFESSDRFSSIDELKETIPSSNWDDRQQYSFGGIVYTHTLYLSDASQMKSFLNYSDSWYNFYIHNDGGIFSSLLPSIDTNIKLDFSNINYSFFDDSRWTADIFVQEGGSIKGSIDYMYLEIYQSNRKSNGDYVFNMNSKYNF